MRLIPFLVLLVAGLLGCGAHAETLKVLTTGAYKQMVVAMAPIFTAQSGHQLDIQNDTAGALVKRIDAGESFDVLVLTPGPIRAFVNAGKIAESSVSPLAKVAIGLAIPAGLPAPRLASVEDFKQILQGARRIAYINPASGGSSGIYLDGLFQRLGLAEMIRPKAVLVNGGLVAEKLISREADLAIHQISEILPVKDVTLIGPLPEEIQNYTVYVGAINKTTQHESAASAFLAMLTSPAAQQVMQSKGMLPVTTSQ